MITQPSSILLETAAMLTEAWATCIMPHFRNLDASEIEVKGTRVTASGKVEKDIVTTADKRVGPFVREFLSRKDPERILVNEENRKVGGLLLDLAEGKKAMLDDLDGSEWFGKGLPDFGMLFSTTNDGIAASGYVLCTFERPDGLFGCSIVMGDDESGVWFIPGIGHKPHRVPPFSERSPKTESDSLHGVITGRYFNDNLLHQQQEITAVMTKAGETLGWPGLRLQESGSAVRLWTDFILGKIDFVSLTPTRPWDQNAGGYLTQRLGGEAVSMDNWEKYQQWRYDGGIHAAPSKQILVKSAERLFITGANPMNREPCVPDLLKPIYEPINKERLRRLADRNGPALVNDTYNA